MNKLITLMAVSSLVFSQSAFSAKVLSAQGGASGGSSHVPLVAFGKTASDGGVAEIQVTDGNALTKSAIAVATKKADMAILPLSVLNLLNNAAGPYQKLGKEKSNALKSQLRQVFAYRAGHYTLATFADSNVKTLEDLKGKKVFVGPPKGAAANTSIAIIKAATGYAADKDYQAVRMGWGAIMQAFIDRKIDAMFRPGPWPNAMFSQMAASGEIRIIGMNDNVMQSKASNKAGFEPIQVSTALLGDGFTFVNETDGKVNKVSYVMSLNVHKDMDDNLVYDMTKAFFERYDQAMKAAAWMPGLEINKVVTGLDKVGGKLHPGAVRYYKEAGIDLPESLL